MRTFLQRISSRKFLTALAVQIAAVVVLFAPGVADTAEATAIRISALVAMLLAALGYGKIEAAVDADQSVPEQEEQEKSSAN